ncbi:transcription intermediary factor 1-alpha-like [Mya arenaria]|uniref:transcription intermediary factor 1-alpha-like n=1 Tax=Mya arenaria TaxID=6604 RepID=UPI0022E8B2EC|nr:transcription intermediary factor 1-alpha-like [Mya arenaria]
MASNFESSIHRGCDFIHDYSCSPCEENGYNTEAQHYCTQCTKHYCQDCVSKHNGLYQKHALLSRKDVEKWEAAPGVVDALERCEMHPGEALKLVCCDHDQLCCSVCVAVEHRQCPKIYPIPDGKGIQRSIEFQQVPKKMAELQKQLEKMKEARMKNTMSLKKTRAAISDEIKTIGKKINEILDKIEKTVFKDLDGMIAKLENNIMRDIETCDTMTIKLQNMIAAFQTKAKSSESKSYIAYRKSHNMILQADEHVRGISTIECYNVTFQANNLIEELLSSMKTFGAIEEQTVMTKQRKDPNSDPNHVISVSEYKKYNVKMSDDEYQCEIFGICEMPTGDFVLADGKNCELKLLDKDYRELDHYDVPEIPWDVCHIEGNEVAVCVCNNAYRKGLYFINAAKGDFVTTRKLSFDHDCIAAAHHGGQLYISSGTALYVYTMTGQKVKMLYEDKSDSRTVRKCAISNDGKKIYITNNIGDQLITVDSIGTKLAQLTDPDMKKPTGVQVTPAGHVFVCCLGSDIVMQVDKDGKKKLATLARERDGVYGPHGLFFSSRTSSLIVGGVKCTLLVIRLI